jgi:hypothetical protein
MFCSVCAAENSIHYIPVVGNERYVFCQNCLTRWDHETGLLHRGYIPGEKTHTPRAERKFYIPPFISGGD